MMLVCFVILSCIRAQRGLPLIHLDNQCVFMGTPAYPLRLHLQKPYRNVVLTPAMQAYNKAMSNVRSSVEWLFGDIINYFKFLDFKKNLKIGMRCVGKMYVVCALLRNALTCLYATKHHSILNLIHLNCRITLHNQQWCNVLFPSRSSDIPDRFVRTVTVVARASCFLK